MNGLVRGAGIALILLCGVGAGQPRAQDALYGKQPPPGSTYVRFVNALAAPVMLKTNFLGDVRVGMSPAERSGLYGVVERAGGRALSVRADAGGGHLGELDFKVAADGYVTVAVTSDAGGQLRLVPIVDRLDFNQTKSRLAFYNIAPGCATASLVLDQGGAAVFQGVANAAASSRTVNPVQATVTATCGGVPGPSLTLKDMAVGTSYSIWLMQPGKDTVLALTPDKLAPYKP